MAGPACLPRCCLPLWDCPLGDGRSAWLLAAHGPSVKPAAKSFAPGDFSVHFFLQLAVILFACCIVGWLGKVVLRQPQVVGEMIAGVLLGPSLLGLFAPDLQKLIFPPETKGVLYVGAQFGVGLYMFLVGLGFRSDHFKANVHKAAAVSVSGMVRLSA